MIMPAPQSARRSAARPDGTDRAPRAHHSRPAGPATVGGAATAGFMLLLDAALVTVFAATGNSTHRSGLDIGSILSTAWPFLAGLVLTSLACRFWRRPAAIWPDGVLILLGTVTLGMVLRAASGTGGVQLSFVLVTLGVLGVMLLGRRALSMLALKLLGRR